MRRALLASLFVLAVHVLAAAQVPAPAAPITPAPQTTVRDTLDQQFKAVIDGTSGQGFAPDAAPMGRPTVVGLLGDRSIVYLEVTLEATREYFIAVACDTDCNDIDTRLLHPDFSLLAEDVVNTDVPRLEVKPTQSGRHVLAVGMASCRTQLCYFGVVIVSRPVRP